MKQLNINSIEKSHMKYYINFALILFSFFLISNVKAQSGYMGKKYAVGMGSNIGLKWIDINSFPKLTFDYFEADRISYRFSLFHKKYFLPETYRLTTYYNGSQFQNYIPLSPLEVNMNGGSLAILAYPEGFIAPVGTFHKIEYSFFYLNSMHKYFEGINEKTEKLSGNAQYISYELGKRFIIKNKILITFGTQLSLNLVMMKGAFSQKNFEDKVKDSYDSFVYNEDLEYYYSRMANFYINNRMFFSVDFGIAYLL